jgi:Ser/Thr protein kinase RdoA (MazF antagonist)
MIPEPHAKIICDEFDLGQYMTSSRIDRGVLNTNYSLTTSKGKFFIKSVRAKSIEALPGIRSVESFMKCNGIPAICMVTNRAGSEHVLIEGTAYTVYPFVEGIHKEVYTDDDFYCAGTMLGKIHSVTVGLPKSKDILAPDYTRPNDGKLRDILLEYKKQIEEKENRDDIDKKFLKLINAKLDAQGIISEIRVPNDTVVHGDFHMGNIFLDPVNSEIVGVCDWEKTEFAPSMYELARAVLVIAEFGGVDEYESLRRVERFLSGYASIRKFTVQEFMDGLRMRLRRLVFSKWLEVKYYRDHDSRANHFIESDTRVVEMFTHEGYFEKVQEIVQRTL